MYTAREVHIVVGIDEAGRGPLAGPLALGAVALGNIQHSVLNKLSTGLGPLRDSKRLTAEQREQWFAALVSVQKRGELRFVVTFVRASVIDARGISAAARLAVARVLRKLTLVPRLSSVLLDGLLIAPKRFREQRTIIRGDETEPLISLASIVAKVLRDRHMVRMARRFPNYGFERHKGYGTSAHYAALERYGPCAIHRRSFLRGVI
ncbi:MAG: ribonuclease HII [bacterium]|nr:ribonuclease HII [bacterium]MDZ4285186.1 ribonuclease HII [Patescibacteria group bacterium]